MQSRKDSNELFQSGYAGLPYLGKTETKETSDNRIWLVNDLGQKEILWDPDDEVNQGLDVSDNPSQLEAVISHINEVFDEGGVSLPDKPWLPNLPERIVSGEVGQGLKIPLGLMDKPDSQSQEVFYYDLKKHGHTAIYSSPGYGKSTALQSIAMNLARQNNPEEINFNLLDFGTNGLLVLKDLPQTVDLSRLDEQEKLIKHISRINGEIKRRKELFTEMGVSSLEQYEEKTGIKLPVIVTMIDNLDNSHDDDNEELIDNLLGNLLREGSNIGMYSITTALKDSSFKMSLRSIIPTKIVLFTIENEDTKDIIGRDMVEIQEIPGRAQIKLDTTNAFQIYLSAKNSTSEIEAVQSLENEVAELSKNWSGIVPDSIPMLPNVIGMEKLLTDEKLDILINENKFPIGYDIESTDILYFDLNNQKNFLIVDDLSSQSEYEELLIFEMLEKFSHIQRVIFDSDEKYEIYEESYDKLVLAEEFRSFTDVLFDLTEETLIYIPDVTSWTGSSGLDERSFKRLIRKDNLHFIFQSDKSKLDIVFDNVGKSLRRSVSSGLVGSRLSEQSYVKVKAKFNEPILAEDETYYFKGRDIKKMKLVSEE